MVHWTKTCCQIFDIDYKYTCCVYWLNKLLCHCINAQSLNKLLYCSYMIRQYCVVFRELVLSRVQLRCDGARWRTGGEVKGKLVNGVGSQYPSHYLRTWCIQHYYRWCAAGSRLSRRPSSPPADLNGLVRFAERRNLVSPRVCHHV